MRNQAARKVDLGIGSSLRVIGYDADAAVGTLDEFVLLLWRRRIVPSGVRWAREGFTKVLGSQKEDRRAVFLTALQPGCDLSTSSEVRKDVAALLKTYEWRLACAAIVFENNGFGMTIVRSVITAINMMSRSRFPNAVFGNLDGALSWMEPHAQPHGIDVDHARVVDAFDRLRAL